MKQPWLKFYPGDWRSDAGVRSCSLAARGLWIEMLCLMHPENGNLVINNSPVTPTKLANIVGIPVRECERLMLELSEAGVYSIDDFCIFSRRMRRDVEKAARDRDNGKNGGNPNLRKGVNPKANPQDKAQKLEARGQNNSSSSACAKLEAECREAVGSEPVLLDPDFTPIADLVASGVDPADVLTGIAAAMAEPNFRARHWSQLVGWARRAAKDRLADVSKPQARAGPAPPGPKKSASQIAAALNAKSHERTHNDPNVLDLTATPV